MHLQHRRVCRSTMLNKMCAHVLPCSPPDRTLCRPNRWSASPCITTCGHHGVLLPWQAAPTLFVSATGLGDHFSRFSHMPGSLMYDTIRSYTSDPDTSDGVDELGSCLCKLGYGGVINGKTTCQDCITGDAIFCLINDCSTKHPLYSYYKMWH